MYPRWASLDCRWQGGPGEGRASSSFNLQGIACVGAGEGGFMGPSLKKGISKVSKVRLELS